MGLFELSAFTMVAIVLGLIFLVMRWGFNQLMIQRDPLFRELLLKNTDEAIKSGFCGFGAQQVIYQKLHLSIRRKREPKLPVL